MFTLHPKLEADSIFLLDLSLSQLRLINDCQFPWFILVPRRNGISEIFQLTQTEQQQLWRESALLSEILMRHYGGDKLNLAAIGNLVPQLHLHHVVRFVDDPVWPAPIWGKLPMQAYTAADIAHIKQSLLPALQQAD